MSGDRQQRASTRTSDTIASFLLKTYEILEHQQNKKMITWDSDGVGFVVVDVVAFTKQILPKYFRHSNFSSFVRQLNMYDFHKVKQENDSLVFKNPLFIRGEQQKLRFIKRKASKKMGDRHHRRFYGGERANSQNQKYANSLKWLKKSIESQINQSCIFYEKSIELLKQNNEANKQKSTLIKQITQNKQNGMHSQNEVSSLSGIDALYQLREECEYQLIKTQKWLQEYCQIFKRKLKSLSGFNLQIAARRQENQAQYNQQQPIEQNPQSLIKIQGE